MSYNRKTKNNQTEWNIKQTSGNYQFTQGMEKHIKHHHRDAISQIQNVENSTGQVTQFLKKKKKKTKGGKKRKRAPMFKEELKR